MASNLNGPTWNPGDLRAGTRVEICPYPKRYKVSFDNLQGYDGSEGIVELLAGYGDQLKARVIVDSKTPKLSGTHFFPAKALRVLPKVPKAEPKA